LQPTAASENMSRRAVILFACVTAIHLVSTIGLMLYVFGAGMARFDSGVPRGWTETLAGWLLTALSVPLLTVLARLPILGGSGLWGYISFLANASLWGLAVVAARRRLRALASRRRQAAAQQPTSGQAPR
jgi:hypothetical protein